MNLAASEQTYKLDEPRLVARFDLVGMCPLGTTDQSDIANSAHDGIIRFVVSPKLRIKALVDGLRLDSTADIEFPTADVDTDETIKVRVEFYFGESPVVVVTGNESMPRSLVAAIVDEVIYDLPTDEAVRDLYGAGHGVRWSQIRILRRRVRDVEESVRRALDDDHVTEADYKALREYAVRLARVEKLASELPEPTSKNYKPNQAIRRPYLTRSQSTSCSGTFAGWETKPAMR